MFDLARGDANDRDGEADHVARARFAFASSVIVQSSIQCLPVVPKIFLIRRIITCTSWSASRKLWEVVPFSWTVVRAFFAAVMYAAWRRLNSAPSSGLRTNQGLPIAAY